MLIIIDPLIEPNAPNTGARAADKPQFKGALHQVCQQETRMVVQLKRFHYDRGNIDQLEVGFETLLFAQRAMLS